VAGLAVTLQAETPAAPGAAGAPTGQSAGDAGRLVQAQAAAALAAVRRFLDDPRASNLAAAHAALADIERLLAAG
jgi:hypothetical protein